MTQRRIPSRWGPLLTGLAAWTLLASAASAAEPPPTPTPATAPTAAPPAPPPPDAEAVTPPAPDPIDERAAAIEAFLKVQLATTRRPAELLVFDLADPLWTGPRADCFRAVLAALSAGPARPGATAGAALAVASGGQPVDAAIARLQTAARRLLSLSPEALAELTRAHEARALAAREEDARRQVRILELRARAEQLAALMAGELDVAVDAAALVRLDLADPAELGRAPGRLIGANTPPAGKDEAKSLAAEVAGAEAALDRGRLAFAQQPPEQRRAQLAAHAAARKAEQKRAARAAAEAAKAALDPPSVAPDPALVAAAEKDVAQDAERLADEAAKERQEALEEMSQARSESLRRVAEERARLLGVKEALARFRGTLERPDERLEAADKALLGWVRRLEEIERGAELGDDVGGLADELYDELESARRRAAAALTERLDEQAEGATDVPAVGRPAIDDPAIERDEEVRRLRTGLLTESKALTLGERQGLWAAAEGWQQTLAAVNGTRLRLIEHLSGPRRAALTSFGAAGVRQVGRELTHMRLQVRHRLASLPRVVDRFVSDAGTSPVPLLFRFLELVLLIFVFRWWRRRGPDIIKRMWEAARAASGLGTGLLAAALWYLRRIHRPLELLTFIGLTLGIIEQALPVPELGLVWLVAKWVLIGLLIVRSLDALAARPRRHVAAGDPTSELRFRSLRLVGLTIVVVGLILAITARAVGQGALYSWVFTTCWILVIPIGVLLVRWWRPTVIRRLSQRAELSGILLWAYEQRDRKLWGFISATVGAVLLFVESIYQRLFRQLTTFDVTRRALAYLVRRGVQRQARAVEVGDLVPLDDELIAKLVDADGDGGGHGAVLEVPSADDLERVAADIQLGRSPFVAIVAERGLGKTAHTNQLASALDEGADVLRIRCHPDGWPAMTAALADALGLPGAASDDALTGALRERAPTLVIVEDVHRLVQPVIGGLEAFDRCVALARDVGGRTAWVFTFDSAVWLHVARARADRSIFTRVLKLSRWTEEAIGQLAMARAEAAGLSPTFEGLVLPRQPDQDADMDPEERSRQGFFRVLWDYADGNPAVAMTAWARSLFRRPDGQIVVRLFQAPAASDLSELTPSLLFVLRTVVQRDLATAAEIAAATLYSNAEIAESLRYAIGNGYLEAVGDRVRIAWPWYRAVTVALRRRHLLAA